MTETSKTGQCLCISYCIFHGEKCTAIKKLAITLKIQSSNPPFTSIELDHSDSGREGCTVTTLTVTAEPKNWQSAIKVAVQEVFFFSISSVRKTFLFI